MAGDEVEMVQDHEVVSKVMDVQLSQNKGERLNQEAVSQPQFPED